MAQFDDLPAAIVEIDRHYPGAFWLLAYGRTRADEPPFGVRILFGSDEVLAEGEGETPAAAIYAALGAPADVQAAQPRSA